MSIFSIPHIAGNQWVWIVAFFLSALIFIIVLRIKSNGSTWRIWRVVFGALTLILFGCVVTGFFGYYANYGWSETYRYPWRCDAKARSLLQEYSIPTSYIHECNTTSLSIPEHSSVSLTVIVYGKTADCESGCSYPNAFVSLSEGEETRVLSHNDATISEEDVLTYPPEWFCEYVDAKPEELASVFLGNTKSLCRKQVDILSVDPRETDGNSRSEKFQKAISLGVSGASSTLTEFVSIGMRAPIPDTWNFISEVAIPEGVSDPVRIWTYYASEGNEYGVEIRAIPFNRAPFVRDERTTEFVTMGEHAWTKTAGVAALYSPEWLYASDEYSYDHRETKVTVRVFHPKYFLSPEANEEFVEFVSSITFY